ncbi:FxLYD domain-containing protein [Ralstonia pseudosolanacearum]|uniref:FxLYD domain-containing protein n=1 Tax=Ralstonia pseudosolanacearum TaxID=1310165 RepID=UPI0018D01931|nr:FxLYD domain-containing protein [Ralstonia pseudosolanacearum]
MRYQHAIVAIAAATSLCTAHAQVANLPVTDVTLVMTPAGLPAVQGTLHNNTGQKTRQIFITFALLDAAGAQLGITMASTTALEAGQSWRFEAMSPYRDVATAKLVEVKAY